MLRKSGILQCSMQTKLSEPTKLMALSSFLFLQNQVQNKKTTKPRMLKFQTDTCAVIEFEI